MIIPFLFVACAALRLARFNVSVSRLPNAYFQGLPSPSAAGLIATFVIFNDATGFFSDTWVNVISMVLAVGIGALMISSIPFPSFKEVNWRSRASFGYLMIALTSLVLIAAKPEITLFGVLLAYTGLSLFWYLFQLARGKAPKLNNTNGFSNIPSPAGVSGQKK